MNEILEHKQKQMEVMMQINFHKEELNRVKKAIPNCTYLSHEKRTYSKEKGKGEFYFFKAILENELGGKDTVFYEYDGDPSTMKRKDYKELYDNLKDSAYVNKAS